MDALFPPSVTSGVAGDFLDYAMRLLQYIVEPQTIREGVPVLRLASLVGMG